MTELAHYTPPVTTLASPADVATRRLGEWAQSAMAAHEIATTLVQTSFVPEQFRGQAGEATAAILAGIEVGLNPMAALRSFDIISGTAAPRAITLRAVVQAAGHEIILLESTATRCRMKGKRRGSSEWQEVTWTLDRAKRLGLAGKKNWRDQPEAMLLARATSECARLVASDAILGIGYAVEEIDDGAAEPTATVSRATGTRRTAKRAQAPVAAVPDPEPPLEEPPADPPADEPPADDGEPLTDPQMKKMHASFNDMGITDREERLALTRNLLALGELTSANELTKYQASTLIDLLEQCLGEPEPAEALRALAGTGEQAHIYLYDNQADNGTCAVCKGFEDDPRHEVAS